MLVKYGFVSLQVSFWVQVVLYNSFFAEEALAEALLEAEEADLEPETEADDTDAEAVAEASLAAGLK